MTNYLIKDTTKAERIQLIKEWQEPEDCAGESGMDLFDMYDAYIKGEKEIAQINAEFQAHYIKGEPEEEPKESEPKTAVNSVASELMKLKELLEEGLLSQEEFDAAKKKILE